MEEFIFKEFLSRDARTIFSPPLRRTRSGVTNPTSACSARNGNKVRMHVRQYGESGALSSFMYPLLCRFVHDLFLFLFFSLPKRERYRATFGKRRQLPRRKLQPAWRGAGWSSERAGYRFYTLFIHLLSLCN